MSFIRNLLKFKKPFKPTNQFNANISKIIGYKPYNIDLFINAFTHSSLIKDKSKVNHFERMEFLGDAILGSLIATFLYSKYPIENEGFLTQTRSKIVQRKTLNDLGGKLNLSSLLILNNERISLGVHINGNLYEALVGAIFLDAGIKRTQTFIENTLFKHLKLEQIHNQISSYKGFLFEWSQKEKKEILFNTFEEENAQDIAIYVSILRIDQKVVSKGRGTSKKIAEENASKRAYYYYLKNI